MKLFNRLVIVALTCMIIGGCQKELNFDGTSVGYLKAALSGACDPITVNGLYQEDSLLTTDNWVEVQVNASFGGTYELKSDTVNGFSFYRAGAIPSGTNTIRVFATGTPDTSLPTTFHLYYDSSYCTFTVNVVKSTAGGAHYNLGGSPGSCATFTSYGNYTAGTPLDATDSVTFLVSVTQAGTYTISTGTAINGMVFSASGAFPNTGIYQVTLHGSGTPTTSGTSTFSPSGDGSTCTFPITVLPAGTSAASFTFNGGPAPGTCSGAILHGTYTAGTATNSSNTVDLFVTVTAVGSYAIT